MAAAGRYGQGVEVGQVCRAQPYVAAPALSAGYVGVLVPATGTTYRACARHHPGQRACAGLIIARSAIRRTRPAMVRSARSASCWKRGRRRPEVVLRRPRFHALDASSWKLLRWKTIGGTSGYMSSASIFSSTIA